MRKGDIFTYQRNKVDEGGIDFFNDGKLMFKEPIQCRPDQALALVKRLNGIRTKRLAKDGHAVVVAWFERLRNEVKENAQNAEV